MKPIQELITSPFVVAREELEEHINRRADEFIVLIEEKGHESLKKLNSGKIRALEQLGLLIDAKHLSSEDLNRTVCNLNGQSIEELKKQHGDNVRFAMKDGKLLALPPTYKEYMDNIENGIYAGLIHFKLVAEKYNTDIEVVDPENNYQPHTDAPNGGTINPTKNVDGKSMIVAYILSKEKGKVGHFAPVIEVDGKLQVIDISQNLGTKDQCFAQTMLFYEKYKEGKLSRTDINSIQNYGISSTDIGRFKIDLAQFGRGSSSVRYDYHEGVTVKHSQLLGGARQEQRPFEERVHSNPAAGRYGHLDRRWRGRKGIYEINHIPPKASYRDTPYRDISINHMPAIAMFIEDHRGMSSTGSSDLAFSHRSTVQECLRRGDMYSAMKLELSHTLTINPTRSYENAVLQYINYVGSTPVKGAPLNLDGTRSLLTRSQALQSQEELFGR
ncbi:unnamed protein product [Didymodactylos carnosus]|uniref:Uncharacterized protein n=1 Tax=Didymodactylos carnosus TaxID=1234261 RepID=A0A8S2EUN4_9BILA|nr:unnamed protein product [Didymodactylos carnosus]CAF4120239.1 unnamed protein product [Didymodactylos carnosus]